MFFTVSQHFCHQCCRNKGSPVCVRAILGNNHLQLAQPTHRCSVSASGELQKETLLLLTKRVQRLPKLPSMQITHNRLLRVCRVSIQNTMDVIIFIPIPSSESINSVLLDDSRISVVTSIILCCLFKC